MIHIVSFSGGVGSAITLQLVVEEFGRDNVIALFADTLMEDEDLYRFNRDVETLVGLKLTKLCYGLTPWELFNERLFISNNKIDHCSQYLKRALLKKWVRYAYKPDECFIWIGIDWSEKHRLERAQKGGIPYIYRSILVERDIMLTAADKVKWCKANKIELPKLYKLGFSHNNCGGFCVKAGLGHFRLLYKTMPDRYLFHEKEEQKLLTKEPKCKPFLQKEVKGKRLYMSLKVYREEYLDKDLAEEDRFDIGGCGCAL